MKLVLSRKDIESTLEEHFMGGLDVKTNPIKSIRFTDKSGKTLNLHEVVFEIQNAKPQD